MDSLSTEADITYVEANTSNTIFPEHSAFKHAAYVVHAFKSKLCSKHHITGFFWVAEWLILQLLT